MNHSLGMSIEAHTSGVVIYADWLDEPIVGPWYEAYWKAVSLRR